MPWAAAARCNEPSSAIAQSTTSCFILIASATNALDVPQCCPSSLPHQRLSPDSKLYMVRRPQPPMFHSLRFAMACDLLSQLTWHAAEAEHGTRFIQMFGGRRADGINRSVLGPSASRRSENSRWVWPLLFADGRCFRPKAHRENTRLLPAFPTCMCSIPAPGERKHGTDAILLETPISRWSASASC